MHKRTIEIHGHRGCRGYLPENTIPSFKKAIDLGCDTLELDVVLTKDLEVLVSHEPWCSHKFCTLRDGSSPTKENEKQFNLYKMSYEEIKQIDCGKRTDRRFPQQQGTPTYKPLLEDLIEEIDAYTQSKGLEPIAYNIEVKCVEEEVGIFHPNAAIFSQAVLDVIRAKKIEKRSTFQTFNLACLQYVYKVAKDIKIALLIDNPFSLEENLERLGFCPDVFGPNHTLINQTMMDTAKSLSLPVIPWTVNEVSDIHRALDYGVAGIISDYPDRVVNILLGEGR